MHIEINEKTTIKEIQQAFSNYFPYLELEFYRTPHRKYNASPESEQVESSFCIGDLHPKVLLERLEILPLYRVADIEKEFQEKFGLSVQVLRREKNKWEQTTGMDDFTLKELNQFGKDSSDEEIVTEYTENLMTPEEKPSELL